MNATELNHQMAALRERAEAAEAELEAVRDDNHSMMLEIHNLRIERDALADELAKLRQQEPVAYVKYKQTGGNVGLSWVAIPTGAFYPNECDPLYAAPVPAVAAGLPAIGPYRDFIPAPAAPAPYLLGGRRFKISINGEGGFYGFDGFHELDGQWVALVDATDDRHMQSDLAAAAVPATTPFIPDDDTRRNDEAFAYYCANRAVLNGAPGEPKEPATSVPGEWREVMAELAADLQAACDAEHPHRDQYPSVMRKYQNDMRIVERARALLQSTDHSEQALEKVTPDCRTCANRGQVNGLSQESYCESCVYQVRGWRQNHFVDASKMVDTANRRCEACAILPCSCK